MIPAEERASAGEPVAAGQMMTSANQVAQEARIWPL